MIVLATLAPTVSTLYRQGKCAAKSLIPISVRWRYQSRRSRIDPPINLCPKHHVRMGDRQCDGVLLIITLVEWRVLALR